jgi:hypothetical protein
MRCSVIICLFWSLGLCPAYSQLSATIKMDHGEVTAGDTVDMVITFDKPTTCSQSARVYMVSSDNSQSLDLRGQLEGGKNTATVSTVIPKDYHGEFHSVASFSFLSPCQGYSVQKPFTFTPVTLNIRGIPDPNNYPAKADVVLSLSQKQFLDTKVAELNDLSGQIDTRVERSGVDSVELRAFLAGIVEKAEADLQATERQYRTELLKPTDPLPAFFADFQRQYSALHVELKAPIPGTRANIERSAHLLYVQQPLNRRSPSDTPAKGRNLSGTFPAIARATKATINDNASAYAIVNSTGKSSRPEFHARFESLPIGATIYYRQAILTDFNVWSSKTNISGADFELATFVFKFHKDECEDEPVVTVDPYVDTHPNISVEFKRCGKK